MIEKMNTKSLGIFIFAEKIVAFQSENLQPWTLFHIKGGEFYSHQDHLSSFDIVLEDISDNLNLKEKLANVKVSVIYQQGKDDLIVDSIKSLVAYQCSFWQIINWESISQYARQILELDNQFFDTKTIDYQLLQDHILPLVWHENSIEHQQQALATLRQEKHELEQQLALMHSDTEQALAQQVTLLENEKNQLQQQIMETRSNLQRLQQPDLESLLAYLPVIFKDFWNVVRPDELSVIVGVLNPPTIPSPYHSPNLSTVQQKKRQFMALSETSQNKILDLCRELVTHHSMLKVHQEFKVLIGALD